MSTAIDWALFSIVPNLSPNGWVYTLLKIWLKQLPFMRFVEMANFNRSGDLGHLLLS